MARIFSGRFLYHKLIKPIVMAHAAPHPIALGIALGLFIGFTPTIPLQMPLALILATILGANKVVAMAMTWPSFLAAVPVFWLGHYVGIQVLGGEPLTLSDLSESLKHPLEVFGKDLFRPLMLGSVIVAFALSAPWYPVSLWALKARRNRMLKKANAKLAGCRLVLATTSPRRAQLLREWGYKFEIAEAHIHETTNKRLGPVKTAKHNAFRKALNVARRYDDAIVIAADTVVVLNKEMMGKPVNDADAERMLQDLSGTRHSVITAVCAIDSRSGRKVLDSDEAFVRMRHLPHYEIKEYVKTGAARGKAGAYAMQETGDKFVTKVDGNLDTVVGLPRYVCESVLYRLLTKPPRKRRTMPQAANRPQGHAGR